MSTEVCLYVILLQNWGHGINTVMFMRHLQEIQENNQE